MRNYATGSDEESSHDNTDSSARIGRDRQDAIAQVIKEAADLVTTHTADLEGEMSFDHLSMVLLKIADSLARINRTRIGVARTRNHRSSEGAPPEIWNKNLSIPPIEDETERNLKQVIDFGIEVANRMRDNVASRIRSSTYDVFLSFAGEEKPLYVPLLYDQLTENNMHPFHDTTEMGGGKTPDTRRELLENVLSATVVVCVVSFHAVQKKWPIAELLCGLARNEQARRISSPSTPLIIDAMPGQVWLSSSHKEQRHPKEWGEDIKNLFFLTPSFEPCRSNECKYCQLIRYFELFVF